MKKNLENEEGGKMKRKLISCRRQMYHINQCWSKH